MLTRDDLIEIIVKGMTRGNNVSEWPDDEVKVNRRYFSDDGPAGARSFSERNAYVARYRAGKVVDEIYRRLGAIVEVRDPGLFYTGIDERGIQGAGHITGVTPREWAQRKFDEGWRECSITNIDGEPIGYVGERDGERVYWGDDEVSTT